MNKSKAVRNIEVDSLISKGITVEFSPENNNSNQSNSSAMMDDSSEGPPIKSISVLDLDGKPKLQSRTPPRDKRRPPTTVPARGLTRQGSGSTRNSASTRGTIESDASNISGSAKSPAINKDISFRRLSNGSPPSQRRTSTSTRTTVASSESSVMTERSNLSFDSRGSNGSTGSRSRRSRLRSNSDPQARSNSVPRPRSNSLPRANRLPSSGGSVNTTKTAKTVGTVASDSSVRTERSNVSSNSKGSNSSAGGRTNRAPRRSLDSFPRSRSTSVPRADRMPSCGGSVTSGRTSTTAKTNATSKTSDSDSTDIERAQRRKDREQMAQQEKKGIEGQHRKGAKFPVKKAEQQDQRHKEGESSNLQKTHDEEPRKAENRNKQRSKDEQRRKEDNHSRQGAHEEQPRKREDLKRQQSKEQHRRKIEKASEQSMCEENRPRDGMLNKQKAHEKLRRKEDQLNEKQVVNVQRDNEVGATNTQRRPQLLSEEEGGGSESSMDLRELTISVSDSGFGNISTDSLGSIGGKKSILKRGRFASFAGGVAGISKQQAVREGHRSQVINFDGNASMSSVRFQEANRDRLNLNKRSGVSFCASTTMTQSHQQGGYPREFPHQQRGGTMRDPRADPRYDPRGPPRYDHRGDPRGDLRNELPYDLRGDPRSDNRSGPRGGPFYDPRNDPRRYDPRSGPCGDPRGDPRGNPHSGPRGAPQARPHPNDRYQSDLQQTGRGGPRFYEGENVMRDQRRMDLRYCEQPQHQRGPSQQHQRDPRDIGADPRHRSPPPGQLPGRPLPGRGPSNYQHSHAGRGTLQQAVPGGKQRPITQREKDQLKAQRQIQLQQQKEQKQQQLFEEQQLKEQQKRNKPKSRLFGRKTTAAAVSEPILTPNQMRLVAAQAAYATVGDS